MTVLETLYRALDADTQPRDLMIDFGSTFLEVRVEGDVDLDGTFTGVCLDTGETLSINGWLALNIEEI